eukprot:Gb_06932 [translate_table: standard]
MLSSVRVSEEKRLFDGVPLLLVTLLGFSPAFGRRACLMSFHVCLMWAFDSPWGFVYPWCCDRSRSSHCFLTKHFLIVALQCGALYLGVVCLSQAPTGGLLAFLLGGNEPFRDVFFLLLVFLEVASLSPIGGSLLEVLLHGGVVQPRLVKAYEVLVCWRLPLFLLLKVLFPTWSICGLMDLALTLCIGTLRDSARV